MDIFSEIVSALRTEDRVMLATIIATSGSTPASAFSKMIIRSQGTISTGTVGGGCLEGDVLRAAKKLYDANKAEVLTFHLNEDEFVQGLICGGSLDVLVEPLTKNEVSLFRELTVLRDNGEDSVVATFMNNDHAIRFKRLIRDNDPDWKSDVSSVRPEGEADLSEELRRVLQRKETRRIKMSEGELILEPIAGSPTLVIFGGGHVSRSICQVASISGFRVTIVDDREEYSNPRRFPEAVRTIVGGFPEISGDLTIRPSTSVVIVTRGHRYDEDILEEVLKSPAKYIGMIGSKRKVLTTYEHLVERGTPVESLKRVHAPMGIEIGATSAEEIGVSVVAELIAVRRGQDEPYFGKSAALQDLFFRLKKTIRHS